jgi:gluconate 2-dehydrogenase alpha chain
MATRLKDVDAVMVGMGWTGSILARELTKAGLTVVGLERGPDRVPGNDFVLPTIRDELRYALGARCGQRDRDRHLPTFPERERAADAALGRILTGRGRRRRRHALDRTSLALPAE